MKKLLALLLIFIFVGAEAKPKQDDLCAMRIATYNVWSDSARAWQIDKKQAAPKTRSWENSHKAVSKLIAKLKCDIVALQEVTAVVRDDMKADLKRLGYKGELRWWNTYPEGHKSVVGNAVLINTKRFEVLSERMFYLSPTPTKISKGWDETRHYRAAMKLVVREKRSGKIFNLIATHAPLKPLASNESARVLVEIDKNYNTDALPTILLGDMNAWPTGAPKRTFYQTMVQHYEDCFEVARKRDDNIGTFNGSGEYENYFQTPRRRIDHIYVRSTTNGKFDVLTYMVNRDKHKVGRVKHYPSDHNPVVVELELR